MYNLSNLKNKLSDVEAWLAHEYESLRTGRATPAVLDAVNVEIYGAQNKISHIAAISVEDAKTLRIAPWDKTVVKHIEGALQAANLGVSVIVDGNGLRVIFPELNNERRKALERLMNNRHEEARVRIRHERDEIWNDINKKEREGILSEDDKFRLKNELQEMVDESNRDMEGATDRKLKEISQ